MKRWPCCYANHRPFAGIFELLQQHEIKAIDVEIMTPRGRFASHVAHTPGSPEARMTEADWQEEFAGCCLPVLGQPGAVA